MSAKDNAGLSAYPQTQHREQGGRDWPDEFQRGGLTKREKMALHILPALLKTANHLDGQDDAETLVKLAVKYADALLIELQWQPFDEKAIPVKKKK